MTREQLLDHMLRDLIDAVNHFYGPDGLGNVVARMKALNRARETRAEIDALEEMLGLSLSPSPHADETMSDWQPIETAPHRDGWISRCLFAIWRPHGWEMLGGSTR